MCVKKFFFFDFLTGIPVAEFSMNGRYYIDPDTEEVQFEYLNHTLGIGSQNLTDFTVCLRFNVNYLKSITSFPLSYTSSLSDNSLTVRFRIIKDDFGSYKLNLKVCKYQYITKECGIYEQDRSVSDRLLTTKILPVHTLLH